MAFVPGYMGTASVGGEGVAITAGSVTPTQTPLFYQHIWGLRDSGTGVPYGAPVSQKNAYRKGPMIGKASVSFPLTCSSSDIGWLDAWEGYRTEIGVSVDCSASPGGAKGFVTSYSFNCSAGEVASASIEVTGITSGASGVAPDEDMLLTWEQVNIGLGSTLAVDVKTISFSLTNEVMPIHTSVSNQSGMIPLEFRVGGQSVTGNITVYGHHMNPFGVETILNIDPVGIEVPIWLEPIGPEASTGLGLSTYRFVGVNLHSIAPQS